MTRTDEIISEYRKLYLEYNGREPKIEKRRGGWIWINGENYRAEELEKRLAGLRERLKGVKPWSR